MSAKVQGDSPLNIPFTVDSPYFQEELSVSYECIKATTKRLKAIVAKAEQLDAASAELARREADLADSLLAFDSLNAHRPGNQLASACVSMGGALRELCETREIARNGMSESFLKPCAI